MPVIAVVNRKGGSGKSTLATHLAAYCANRGVPVMLGDVDRQQSTQTWLKLRRAQQLDERAPIVGWNVDPKNTLRPPAGISRVVLDTPGGMRGFELARVVMFADLILMPVCNSVFDRSSAADCHAELMSLPRVASGRCQVAAIGMRLDARTKAAETLQQWADALQLPFVGVLRETQAYVRCVEQGLTLFDLPAAQTQADMAQWQPILDWIEPVMRVNQADAAPTPAASASTLAPAPARVPSRSSAPLSMPATVVATSARPATARPSTAARPARPAAARRKDSTGLTRLLGWLGIPAFRERATSHSRMLSALTWADSTRPVKAP